MAYAYMHIEDRVGDDEVVWYEPGEEVPETVNGYEDLVEQGAIGDEPYEPVAPEPPQFVEIDGVRYERKTNDAGE